jgi:hypothetical protein
MKFAIALLAENEGHKINWCALREEFCHWGGKPFESARSTERTWRIKGSPGQ